MNTISPFNLCRNNLADFIQIPESNVEEVRVHPILAERSPMVTLNLFVAGHPAQRGTTCAHGHKVLPDVVRLDATHKNHAQKVLKAGFHLVGGVEIGDVGITLEALNLMAIQLEAIIDRFLAVERWMCRNETRSHPTSAEAF